jgi:hypothetical protein
VNCNHMFVTTEDKKVGRCGLCNISFDEWRDGVTLTKTSTSVSIDDAFNTCFECKAVVHQLDVERHADWHRDLNILLAGGTND